MSCFISVIEVNKRVFIGGKKYLWKSVSSNGSVFLRHEFDDGFTVLFDMPPYKDIVICR